jgi:hypothetical protein
VIPLQHGVLLRSAETLDGWLPRLMPKMLQSKRAQTSPAWLAALKVAAEAGSEAAAAAGEAADVADVAGSAARP